MAKIVFLFLLTLLNPMAHATGVISGGGVPKLIPIPTEDFFYICKVNLSEQMGSEYVAAEAEIAVPKSKFQQMMIGGPTASITTDQSIQWKKSQSSASLPAHLNGHLISLSIRQEREEKPLIDLYVRVLHQTESSYTWADSSADTSFKSKQVSARASSYEHRTDNSGRVVQDLLLSLSVACERKI